MFRLRETAAQAGEITGSEAVAFFSKSVVQAAGIILISAATAAMTYLVAGPPGRLFYCDPAKLEPGEVCLRDIARDAPITWVDARTRKEWEHDGLKGSMLWSLESGEDKNVFEAEAATRIMEKPQVVVYCGGEDCSLSHQVAGMIRKLELGAEVRVLKGGWRALKEAGWIKDSS